MVDSVDQSVERSDVSIDTVFFVEAFVFFFVAMLLGEVVMSGLSITACDNLLVHLALAMNMFKPTDAKTPTEYIKMIDEPRKAEMKQIFALIKKAVPSLKPSIVGGMIGFGKVKYETRSGCAGDWFVIGLASQKQYISVYACVADGKQYLAEKYADQLGKVNVGKSCIRFKKVENLDQKVMVKLLKEAEKMQKQGKNEMYN